MENNTERVKRILTSYRAGYLTEADLMLCLLSICPSIESLVEVQLALNAEDAAKVPPVLTF